LNKKDHYNEKNNFPFYVNVTRSLSHSTTCGRRTQRADERAPETICGGSGTAYHIRRYQFISSFFGKQAEEAGKREAKRTLDRRANPPGPRRGVWDGKFIYDRAVSFYVVRRPKPSNIVIPIGFQNVKNKNDKREESPGVLSNRIHEEIPQK
jgi:hypothetical protein